MNQTIFSKYELEINATAKSQLIIIKEYYGIEPEFELGPTSSTSATDLVSGVFSGIPKIICNPNFTPSTTDICHEIWHMFMKVKMEANGFNFEGDLEEYLISESGSENAMAELFSLLYSVVEHHYFFPKLKGDGYSPTEYIESSLGDPFGWTDSSSNKFESLNLTIQILQLLSINDLFKGKFQAYLDVLIKQPEYSKAKRLYEVLQTFTHDEVCIMKQLVKMLWEYSDEISFLRKNNQIIFI